MTTVLPAGLVRLHSGQDQTWLDNLPRFVAEYLDRWELRPDGAPGHGMASLVLPVRHADGAAAALKIGRVTEENAGEAAALRAWDGDGAVRLLAEDHSRRALLLERLDHARPLSTMEDEWAALRILTDLLARIGSVPPPAGLRRLGDVAAAMLEDVPRLSNPDEQALLDTCAGVVRDLVDEPGDQLLHWDLHQGNVLAPLPGTDREPWLVIDPEPLVGDPGFDLMPALSDRWDEVVASGDVAGVVRRRFDLMTEGLGLDRQRAFGWTLARVLQNCLWDIEDGEPELNAAQVAIGETLIAAYKR
ncbi:aminoglycoside phosphotransferase family protein [Allokutzneria sp. A3M-2-11 16]|uniref:aminoglycoside phosphotransferase family protein n=1 Tax=Allokutzneria sp. A3M-2-11 16 TaxID=2962043 RepID=UPI0020B7DB72|nr:aminoglycoside phosphotransferase family protein [Allokutzneria sp. A3M-2-11 16]MCP3802572.1 aminoglycoside phosphotransferase family protein [Allokutzneria sp. A3M-2-11 16]